MITPQEVSERAFTKVTFGGYNMAMVDEFLDQVTADYTTLFKENALLKGKMKVLVEKIEEYRSTDDAMRKALMSAQKMADDMVLQAESKRAEMLLTAEKEIREQLMALHHEVASEELRLAAAQQATAAFVMKAKEIHQRELAFLDSLPSLQAPPAEKKPDQVAITAEQIEQNIQQMLEDAPEKPDAAEREADAARQEPAVAAAVVGPEREFSAEEAPVVSEEETKRIPAARVIVHGPENTGDLPRTIDLDNLRFGKDYEVT